jgi:hypothetical protein
LLFFLNCSIDDESRSLGFLLSDLLNNVEDLKFIQPKKWFILLLLNSKFLEENGLLAFKKIISWTNLFSLDCSSVLVAEAEVGDGHVVQDDVEVSGSICQLKTQIDCQSKTRNIN